VATTGRAVTILALGWLLSWAAWPHGWLFLASTAESVQADATTATNIMNRRFIGILLTDISDLAAESPQDPNTFAQHRRLQGAKAKDETELILRPVVQAIG
jgi:hypothetical protein